MVVALLDITASAALDCCMTNPCRKAINFEQRQPTDPVASVFCRAVMRQVDIVVDSCVDDRLHLWLFLRMRRLRRAIRNSV